MIMPDWNAPTARVAGWERELAAVLQRHMAMPFAWGVSDCGIMVADVCQAITGLDPLAGGLRRFTTEAGAARLMRRFGAEDVEGVLAALFPAIPPALARRGDCGTVLASIGAATVKASVIVLGPHVVGKGPAGAIHRPRADLVTAFAIG